MFNRLQSLMDSGKLTEELSTDIRQVRRDLDELAVNLRRDLSAMQGDVAELKGQLGKLREDHASHVQALQQAHAELVQLTAAFGKELSEFKLAKSRMESKFQDSVHREVKQYIADLKQNLSGFHGVSKETAAIERAIRATRVEVDKFNAIAGKLSAKDFDLVKFSKQAEALSREKLSLLRKIDFLERLVAKERRRR